MNHDARRLAGALSDRIVEYLNVVEERKNAPRTQPTVTLPRFPEADLALAAETLTAIGNDAPAELRELCKNRFLSTGSIERLGRWLNAYVGSAGCTQE